MQYTTYSRKFLFSGIFTSGKYVSSRSTEANYFFSAIAVRLGKISFICSEIPAQALLLMPDLFCIKLCHNEVVLFDSFSVASPRFVVVHICEIAKFRTGPGKLLSDVVGTLF